MESRNLEMVVEATQKERKNKKETRPINLDKDFRDCHWKQGEKFRGGGGGGRLRI